MRSNMRTRGSATGATGVTRPMHPHARRHARAVEIEVDLIAHRPRPARRPCGRAGCLVPRFVDDDGERRLQGMSEVTDLRARAVDDILVGVDERVELGLQWLDLGRQLAFEPCRRRRSGSRPIRARSGAAAAGRSEPGTASLPPGRDPRAPARPSSGCGNCADQRLKPVSGPATIME